jgi:hypothetical protein
MNSTERLLPGLSRLSLTICDQHQSLFYHFSAGGLFDWCFALTDMVQPVRKFFASSFAFEDLSVNAKAHFIN